jgi:3-hydroxyisobutyrate dehydrogenase-like beta-hydroxyacid dehydrogenase
VGVVGPVGVVGLGNMGSALAANLVAAGHEVVAHDLLGAARAPAGTRFLHDAAEVARRADTVVLSLPDAAASEQVVAQILGTAGRRVTHVVETSTIGLAGARAVAAQLASESVAYVDAPVSGGVAGARARTLAVMYAGPDAACTHVTPVLEGLSDRRFRVGDRPGMGQAMKLANNFLAATTLAATSEAVAFGRSAGLDMAVMLEVLNRASGQSAATTDKFPSQVLTGRFAAGFANTLMAKDVRLYHRAVQELGGPAGIGQAAAALWERFAADEPGADFTRIFPYLEGSSD